MSLIYKKTILTLFIVLPFMVIQIFSQVADPTSQAAENDIRIFSELNLHCKRDQAGGGEPNSDIPPPVHLNCLLACDSSTMMYYVDSVPGANYLWSVNGELSYVENQHEVFVSWGEAGQGNLSVLITYSDGSVDSSSRCIEIIETPVADFTSLPPNNAGIIEVCLYQDVNFFDNSINADDWFWDFGDGSYFAGQNPPSHSYMSSGTYTVTLIVKNECGCPDTTTQLVEVDELPGPEIECPSVVCAGDTVEYSTTADCGDYYWNIEGGTIISSPVNSSSILVVWDDEPDGQGIVTLDVAPCGGFCASPTSIVVPIIPSSAIVYGDTIVCQYAFEDYSVPKIPGTKYIWDISPGGQLQSGQGSHDISVYWDTPGYHTITVDYFNEFLGCGGTAQLDVFVAPEFYITGPTELCAYSINSADPFYTASSNGFINANWTIITPLGNVLTNYETGTNQLSTYDWSDGPGIYELVAVSTAGTTCNDTAFFQVTVYDLPPLPEIEGDTIICEGGTYQYNAIPGSTDMVYSWFVTGGTLASSTGPVTSVHWTGPPPYTISLVQSMAASPGCSSDTFHLSVNTMPVPVISGPDTVCPDATVTYTADFNNDLTYNWSISPSNAGSIVSGNGTNSIDVVWYNSQSSATLSISYPGCPSLTDPGFPVTILPAAPPVITPSGVLCENGQISLSSSSASTYNWTDGSNQFIASTSSITIEDPGNYNLTITNSYGCVSSENISINEEPSPLAQISSPFVLSYCNTPVPDLTMYALENSGYSYQWLLNGLPVADSVYSSYTTNIPGNYSVIVTLGSCSDTSNVLVISYSTNCGDGCSTDEWVDYTYSQPACNPVYFNDTLSSGIGSFSWNFGDPASGAANTSTLHDPVHLFTVAGFYNVILSGTGPSNQTPPDSCVTKRIITVEVPLVADFDFTNACAGDTVFFSDLSTYTVGNPTSSWSWSFGDPSSGAQNTSAIQHPSHVFSSPGTYVVSLTVSNASCTLTYTDTISIEGVIASFITNPATVCEGQAVSFTPTAISNSPVINWNWDFDDGNTSLLESPQKTFSPAGTYNVSLTMTNSEGCSGSISNAINVIAPIPADSINVIGPNPVCFGDSVILMAQSSTSYLWSTGETGQSIYVDSSGDYSVTVEDANGCPVDAPTVHVDVISPPEFNLTGPETVCEGGFLNLQTGLYGMYDFEWYFDGSLISGAMYQGYNVYGVNSSHQGLYSVVITDQNTGCSFSDSLFVTINPSPDVPLIQSSGSSPLCEGILSQLAVTNVDPQLDYVWNTGETGTSISVATSGYYYVSATNEYGCTKNSSGIFIYPKPDAECVISGCYEFCDTLAPKVIPGLPGYSSYQWFEIDTSANAMTLIDSSQNLTVYNSGAYQLVLTNQYGCVDTSGIASVEFVPCGGCEDLEISAEPAVDENGEILSCCYNISIENMFSDTALYALEIVSLNGADIDFSLNDNTWTVQNISDSLFAIYPINNSIQLGNYQDLIQLCLSHNDSVSNNIVFNWIGQGPDFKLLCADTLVFDCEPESNCVTLYNDSIFCEGDSLLYQFSLQNNSNYPILGFFIETDSMGGAYFNSGMLGIPSLLPGQSYGPLTIGLPPNIFIPGDTICFTISAHDAVNPDSSTFCCSDRAEYCLVVPPLCNPCDSLNISVQGSNLDCCWTLTLTNNTYTDIIGVRTQILTPGAFSSIANPFGSEWSLLYNSPGDITWIYNDSTSLPMLSTLPEICVEGDLHQTEYEIAVHWIVEGPDGDSTLCSDTLQLSCLSDCMGLYEDSVTCDSLGNYFYNFTMYNNFSLDVQSFEFFQLTPPGALGGMSHFMGPIPIDGSQYYSVPVFGQPGDTICFRIKAYNGPSHDVHYNCCTTDSVYCIILPDCDNCIEGIYGPEVICEGEKIELCLNTCCDDVKNIKWSTNEKTECITVDEPGQYAVKWKCGNETLSDIYTVTWADPDSCKQNQAKSGIYAENGAQGNVLQVYPNPVHDVLNVSFSSKNASDINVSLYDINGKQIYVLHNKQVEAKRTYTIRKNMSVNPKGLYLLRMSDNMGSLLYRKIIKVE